ncbi:hypothetical protein FJ656_21910 [Schumannella luteola]|uniref:DUF4190 domain-containing protein n=1 Tax=Schumannella luteola TaxID=472059 RepID=A0A852YN95_9MICO|nr:hypothetical protein [Schumannella luteola]NYG99199.1 hypothetical protein [Schumannella luteola]TPX02511.1 hypothetical protein FJ656_21910 [Schumannella luteola]
MSSLPYPPPDQHTGTAPVAPPRRSPVMGVLALIFGIVSLVLCWLPIVDYFTLVLGIAAIVLGVLSGPRRSGTKLGYWGFWLGLFGATLSFALGTIWTIILVATGW